VMLVRHCIGISHEKLARRLEVIESMYIAIGNRFISARTCCIAVYFNIEFSK